MFIVNLARNFPKKVSTFILGNLQICYSDLTILSDIFCMTNYYYNIASAQKSQNLSSSINKF